jgi:uncharacterized protein YndB with AHSA1/START domain
MGDDAVSTDDLVISERIRASPDEVFGYLVEPDKLVRWMGVEARIDPSPGGAFWLNVTGDDIASGTYVAVERPHRVVFTWGWEGSDEVPPGSSTVSVTLTEDGDETVVELVHRGLPGGQADEHGRGWTYFIERLRRASLGEPLERQNPGSEHA